MLTAVLTIRSQEGTRRIRLATAHLTVGRGDAADVTIDDPGLSRVHASIHSADGRLWILDESSTNGSLVNGQRVPPSGTGLFDGDEIAIGDGTRITITLSHRAAKQAEGSRGLLRQARSPEVMGLVLAVGVVLGIVLLGLRMLSGNRAQPNGHQERGQGQALQGLSPENLDQGEHATESVAASSPTPAAAADGRGNPAAGTTAGGGAYSYGRASQRLYRQMSTGEQAGYVEQQSRHIANMIGKRPCTFTPEVLSLIKYWVDAYARRVGNNQGGLWREDLRAVFKRATRYTPIIIREFRKREINDVIGVYIPMIETEYNNICYENKAGAMGLFQFTGPTARGMGLDPAQRCDVRKITPVAARYIADRLSEFGTDAVGVSLSIAGYNRSPDSVRRDLYNTIDPKNRERSFWTLVANKGRLDEWFQTENIAYVPRFFAAAIIGENPWDFGIDMNQLSSYTEGGDGD